MLKERVIERTGTQVNGLGELGITNKELDRCLERNGSLVILDKDPTCMVHDPKEGAGEARSVAVGLSFTRVGEVKNVTEHVVHGRYHGRQGELALVIDQFVDLRNCIPRAIVRIISPLSGNAGSSRSEQLDLALSLLRSPETDRDKAKGHRGRVSLDTRSKSFCGCSP